MNRKRKGLWPALALICMAALLGVSALWNMLAGQGCFKITAETGEGLTGRLSALQTAEGVELGAFSMKNLQTGTLAPATLYESVLFHPVALGLSMAEGDMSFRTDAEHQILLHTKTAARLIPTGQCVGETVKIEAGQFQVAGLYKGTGLWKNEASAVVSAGESGLHVHFGVDPAVIQHRVGHHLGGFDPRGFALSCFALCAGLRFCARLSGRGCERCRGTQYQQVKAVHNLSRF